MPWRELNAGAISGYEVESTVNSNGVRELQLTSRGSSEGWYKLNAEAVSGYNIEINGQDSKGTINFKTDGTLTSRYFPPDNDSVDFQLQSYTAPSNDAADLSLADFGKILIDQSIVTEVTIDGRVTEDLTVEGDTVSSIVDALPAYNSVEDLVAWYRFEDGDARDYATFEYAADPTAYNGTVNGAVYDQFGGARDFDKGCNSGAYSFDGSTSQYLTLDHQSVNGLSDYTIMLWVEGASSGEYYFSLANSNTANEIIFGESAVSSDWTHVAITRESGNGTAYTNASAGSSGFLYNDDYGSDPLDVDSGGFIIGQEQDIVGGDFNGGQAHSGKIDDIRIYNKALTGSEINQIYQATQP